MSRAPQPRASLFTARTMPRALPSSSSPRRRRLSITTSPGLRLDAASPRAPPRARAASDVVESSSAPLDPIGLNPDRAAVVNADPDAYSWTKQWYPVAVVDVLDETKPHPTTLLGIDLVVWKNGDGSWSVFEDKCPHRLAPLSEGRVESDGTLLCAYHAWRFDGDGKCTSCLLYTSPSPRDQRGTR
mgnify:CR=1 FL=1